MKLQVQGTAGIVKANPAFAIKPTNAGSSSSPLKTSGKANALIYPSYHLSQAAAEVFNGMIKPNSSQGTTASGYNHLMPNAIKGTTQTVVANPASNVGISGLLNMTKQRGLYIQQQQQQLLGALGSRSVVPGQGPAGLNNRSQSSQKYQTTNNSNQSAIQSTTNTNNITTGKQEKSNILSDGTSTK